MHSSILLEVLIGVACVDGHLVPALDQTHPDFLDRRLESPVQCGHATRAQHRDLHAAYGTHRAASLPNVRVDPLPIVGAWIFTPQVHVDDRGSFREAFTRSSFASNVGHALDLQQMNVSISSKGTVRGIHFADVPPSQAKYVQCLSGRVLDVVVDIRVGSPTFGSWEAVELDSESGRAVYVAEGLGHGFCALSDSATVGYLCSEQYAPTREHGIHPLDAELAISWPSDLSLQLSPKDASAPSFHEAAELGLLPSWDECLSFYKDLGMNL